MRKTSLVLAVLVILGGTYGVVRLAWAETGISSQDGNKVKNTPSPSPRPSPQGEGGELPPGAGSKAEVVVKDGKVSVDLVGAELGEVLRKLSSAAGIEITVGEGVSGKVSMKFSDLPLREGLEKIVGAGQSDYALEYVGEGLSKVKLVNKKAEAGKPAGSAAKQAEGCKIEYNEKDKVLKFLDCKGKVIKQVDTTCSRPYVSKNNKYVVIDILVTKTPGTSAIKIENVSGCTDRILAGAHYEVLLMDNTGNVLWNKEIPEELTVGDLIMSDNAETIVFLTGGMEEFFGAQATVLNKAGEDVLPIPQGFKLRKHAPTPTSYILSSNGKYLGVEFSNNFTGFYNLENSSSWEISEHWAIRSISNEGLVGLSTEGKWKYIDLKDHLETK